ncbi:hypothetical protein [Halobacillus salinus]|uniref:Uncharacterized protein n=1 Tax=Halobacillus salinus TaxID=192814 RepID=A0A4Z0H3E1_9BACI|nr:hypothetical protein [Halobacillus salinus]TGB03705.1 hypothetical protein E4663_01495 [Halobacillus salinus]
MSKPWDNLMIKQRIISPYIDGYLILDSERKIVAVTEEASLILSNQFGDKSGVGMPMTKVVKDGYLPYFTKVREEHSFWLDLEGEDCLVRFWQDEEMSLYTFHFNFERKHNPH